jgi:hypothetical protein
VKVGYGQTSKSTAEHPPNFISLNAPPNEAPNVPTERPTEILIGRHWGFNFRSLIIPVMGVFLGAYGLLFVWFVWNALMVMRISNEQRRTVVGIKVSDIKLPTTERSVERPTKRHVLPIMLFLMVLMVGLFWI